MESSKISLCCQFYFSSSVNGCFLAKDTVIICGFCSITFESAQATITQQHTVIKRYL